MITRSRSAFGRRSSAWCRDAASCPACTTDAAYWPLEENDSRFDAKAGQLNYPGDWYIQVEYHDIVRGARTIGHRVAATLTLGGGAVDLAPLGLDAAFSTLPLVQTPGEPAGHATGIGER